MSGFYFFIYLLIIYYLRLTKKALLLLHLSPKFSFTISKLWFWSLRKPKNSYFYSTLSDTRVSHLLLGHSHFFYCAVSVFMCALCCVCRCLFLCFFLFCLWGVESLCCVLSLFGKSLSSFFCEGVLGVLSARWCAFMGVCGCFLLFVNVFYQSAYLCSN